MLLSKKIVLANFHEVVRILAEKEIKALEVINLAFRNFL